MQDNKKKKTVSDLNSLYQEAETSGLELFAEQRNNLLLVNGQHYAKKGSQFWNRLRTDQNIPKDQKLRLVKNHIQRITKSYRNNILAYSPGVIVSPKTESELQDVKAADLNNSVWEDIKERHKLKKKVRGFVSDFVDIGEMICKVGFDYEAGRFIGYEAQTGPDGAPLIDEMGQPVSKPIFSGDHTYERIFGFDFLVDPSAQSFDEARYCVIRKFLPLKDLKAKFKDDPKILAKLGETSDERYRVWYGQNSVQKDSKGMTMVREYYFRKCADYPNGYYFIATPSVILYQGELPLGIFPVIYGGFDEAQTHPRCYSIIKQLRPYQAEINRTASKIAEHQVTLGDDKLVLLGGSKIAHGGAAYGVKAINVTGSAPVVIPGRSGEQFVGYMQAQITEMYQAANMAEDAQELASDADAYARLFRSIKDKKRFTLYTDTVECFLKEICDLSLRYAKAYYTDNMLVPAIGKKERVNIEEFKNTDDLAIQIVIEPASDDVETRMGRQLILNHAIQFAGPQLDRSDIGHLLKNMPYGNFDGAFEELTMDSEDSNNDLLALDRGELPEISEDENHNYMMRKLTNRMKKADFPFLSPEIQENYRNQRQQRRELVAQQQQEIAAANAGFIPTGGYLVGCDMYVEVGGGKAPKRARIPYEAMNYLLDRLKKQGTSQQALQSQNMSDQAAIGNLSQPPAEGGIDQGGPGGGQNQPPPGPPPN